MKMLVIAPLLIGTGAFLGLGLSLSMLAQQAGAGTLLFASLPTAAAGVVLLGLGMRRCGLPVSPWALLRFGMVAGFLGHALPMSGLYWLSSRAGAGYAAFAFTLPAVFTLAFTWTLRWERPTWRRAAEVAAGFLAALLLIAGRAATTRSEPADLLLLLAIPASIGAANVYRSRFMPARVGGEWLFAVTLLASAAVLEPPRRFLRGRSEVSLPGRGLACRPWRWSWGTYCTSACSDGRNL